jgi:hypothetical protein
VRAARQGLKEPMAELLRRHWGTAVLLAERVLGSADRRATLRRRPRSPP